MRDISRMSNAMSSKSNSLFDNFPKWNLGNEGGDIITHRYRKSKPNFEFWQVRVVYNNKITLKKLFKKEEINVPFEFSANYINYSKDEAAAYAKYYIKELIDNGDIPSYVIKDGKIDENLIKVLVHKLEPAYMEKNVSDK